MTLYIWVIVIRYWSYEDESCAAVATAACLASCRMIILFFIWACVHMWCLNACRQVVLNTYIRKCVICFKIRSCSVIMCLCSLTRKKPYQRSMIPWDSRVTRLNNGPRNLHVFGRDGLQNIVLRTPETLYILCCSRVFQKRECSQIRGMCSPRHFEWR